MFTYSHLPSAKENTRVISQTEEYVINETGSQADILYLIKLSGETFKLESQIALDHFIPLGTVIESGQTPCESNYILHYSFGY